MTDQPKDLPKDLPASMLQPVTFHGEDDIPYCERHGVWHASGPEHSCEAWERAVQERDQHPLDAIAAVECRHDRHKAMCAPCAADAVRPKLARLTELEDIIARIHELVDGLEPDEIVSAGRIQTALGQPARQLAGPGGNAEDCPVCSRRRDLPYPWICQCPAADLEGDPRD